MPALVERAPRRRWRIAWLLGLGVLVNYFDRVNLSVSHGALYTAFGISDVAFGYLSAAYNWSYALCQLPVGVVLDRFGVRRVQRIGIFIWSMASFAAAITPSLPGFFGARLLLGVGEAPTFPANAKAIGAWFPARERSFSTSLTRCGGQSWLPPSECLCWAFFCCAWAGDGASPRPASSACSICSSFGRCIASPKKIRS